MAIPRGDFFFRHRRWFLAGVYAVAFLAFGFQQPTAVALAKFFSRHTGAMSFDLWLHTLFGLAAVFVGLGALWRTWGAAYLGAGVVQDKRLHSDRLVGDGPYRLVRNPLYFGNMLFTLGFGLYASPPGCVLLVIGMWAVLRLIIRDEEEAFLETKGATYRAYLATVPRLFPAFRPRIPPGEAKAHWVQGSCGESYLWLLTFSSAALAVTLDQAWYHERLAWGLVAVLPFFLWARSRRQSPDGHRS
jgi:protein-S-isoprenylcysteine O-methyltransferase Ste14